MTIAYDYTSSGTPGTGNISWTHTPVGTPKGVVVFVMQYNNGTDQVTGVTYGGVTMPEATSSTLLKTSTEAMGVYMYFLGSGIPTGAQTVTVTVSDSAEKAAVCFTVTGSTDTTIQEADGTINSTSLANPSTTLALDGRNAFCAIGGVSGTANVASITPSTGWTSSYEYDPGSEQLFAYRYNTIGTADVTAGWTQGADDALAIAVAIRELYVSVTLDPATISATPITIADVIAPTSSTVIVLETAALWFSSSTRREIDVNTAQITATPVPLVVDAPITIALDTVAVTAVGISAAVDAPVTRVMDTAVLTAAAISGAVDAPVTRVLDTASLTATGIDLVPAAAPPVTVTLDPAVLTATAITIPASPTLTGRVLATSPANLIGYWRLNETSGTAAEDSSTQNNDGAYTGVTLANAPGPDGIPIPRFDGSNDYIDVYSSAFNTDFNGQEGTISLWLKVTDAGVWTDGIDRRLAYFYVDSNNFLEIYKHGSTHNLLWTQYKAGGTSLVEAGAYLMPTGWVHVAVTWSKANNSYALYLNGVLHTAASTGLGTWTGVLDSTRAILGASVTGSPSQPWSGWMAHVAVWNTPLTVSQIRVLAGDNYDTFGGVIFTFDDCRSNTLTGLNYMASNGMYATLYAISSLIDTTNYYTHEQLVTLDAAGHVIGNHSATHVDFTTLTQAQIETEISTCDSALTGWGLSRGNRHLAYPYGGYDADARAAVIAQNILTARRTYTRDTLDPKIIDPYQVAITYSIANTSTLENVQDVINLARNMGNYVVILCHGLRDSSPASDEWLNSQWEDLIDWLVGEGIQTKTIVDFYDAMPRKVTLDTSSLTATGNNITLSAISGQSVSLSTAAVTATPVSITTDAPVSRTLDTAALTATGIPLAVSEQQFISLSTATVTAAGIALADVNSAVLFVLDTATLTATGIASAVDAPVSRTLDTAGITAVGIPAAVRAGTTIALDTASITATGIPTVGVLQTYIQLDPAVLTATGIDLLPVTFLSVLKFTMQRRSAAGTVGARGGLTMGRRGAGMTVENTGVTS